MGGEHAGDHSRDPGGEVQQKWQACLSLTDSERKSAGCTNRGSEDPRAVSGRKAQYLHPTDTTLPLRCLFFVSFHSLPLLSWSCDSFTCLHWPSLLLSPSLHHLRRGLISTVSAHNSTINSSGGKYTTISTLTPHSLPLKGYSYPAPSPNLPAFSFSLKKETVVVVRINQLEET